MTHTFRTLLAGTSLLAMTGAAGAAELTFAGGWPPNSEPTRVLEEYAAKVEELSGGDVSIRVFPLSLLSFAEANAGVRDGIADMTGNLMAYFPAEFPNINMLAEFSQLVELEGFAGELSSTAFAGAMLEHVMLGCEACREEAAGQNQVYLGNGVTTSYGLQCMTPLTSVEDLQGKRIRSAGAYWARWAESMGATPVSMSINETLEGLNQGVLDCTASNTADFVNFGFIDVVNYFYIGAPGAQFTVPFTMNRDTWQGLSEAQRKALMEGTASLSAAMTWVYISEGRGGKERAPEAGVEYLDAPQAIIDANRAFIAEDQKAVAAIYEERFGLDSGAEAAATLTQLLEKWSELTAGVEGPEALAEIYWNEVYSKIDVSSYGM